MSVPTWLHHLAERAASRDASGVPLRALRGFLGGLAAGYGAGVRLRNAAYDRGILPVRRLACRVICVGNLTVGGTGKTPTVIWLASSLQAAGRRVTVVLRGYGRRGSAGIRVVSDGRRRREEWRTAGDEAVLLSERLPGIPVMIGADRHAAGLAALAAYQPDVILLDDGFQHRRLHRDVDLVLVDATDPFGGGHLLPRGRLREPVDGLRRAHAILLTRADETDAAPEVRDLLERLAPGVPVAAATHRPIALLELPGLSPAPLGRLGGARVLGVSGIANPGSFRRTLEALGMLVADHLVYPDHHPYGAAERSAIGRIARQQGAQAIVTTEKDAVRFGDSLPAGCAMFAVQAALQVAEGVEAVQGILGLAPSGPVHG